MGMDNDIFKDGQTAGQLADKLGVSGETMAKRVLRSLPDVRPALSCPMSVEEQMSVAAMSRTKRTARKSRTVRPVAPAKDMTSQDKASSNPQDSSKAKKGGWKWRAWVFLALLAVPTIASMGNMYAVNFQITGSLVKSGLLTAMLSFTALGFVAAGVRSWYSILLAVLLIVYEMFCNTTAIYDGLMGGTKGNPTRFLGVVTDIFNCGSYGAAITIGVVIGILIAAVQLASLYELKKTIHYTPKGNESNHHPQ